MGYSYRKRLKDTNGVPVPLFTGDGANGSGWTFTLKDTGGTVIDISGWTLKLALKADENDSASVSGWTDPTGTISVGTDGVVVFDLSSLDIASSNECATLIMYRVNSTKNEPKEKWDVDIRVGGV